MAADRNGSGRTGAREENGGDHATRAAREAAEAQARLDQLRNETGGALSGKEIARRAGLGRSEQRDLVDEDAPPLDWRLTPRNVILQLFAIAIFVFVLWFMIDLVASGITALFS